MISTLHIRYGYDGNIPKVREAELFAQWERRVETFVRRLRGLTVGNR